MLKKAVTLSLNLNLATFNIRCFGFDGNYQSQNKSEHRLANLQQFIFVNFSDCDILILQEIMDLSILNKILPSHYKIYHYSHNYPRHMYVVFACKPEFHFEDIKIVPNTALDTTKSRPILYGKLMKQDQFLTHVFGVHLKSGYEHTSKRILQIQTLKEYIDSFNESDPIIIAGDFNSHNKEKTRQNKDDLYYLREILSKKNITHHQHNQKTYILPFSESELDHFWTKNTSVDDIQVFDPTLYAEQNTIKKYYDEISDHLPVKIKLQLQIA
jgi:endonuclease/exonuclease/phosphatase family metal-dependent hydrolase